MGTSTNLSRMARGSRGANGPSGAELERLLIVEDCDELRRALAATLAERAAEIRSVASVAAAANELRGWSPELVVLDFALPDGDAFDVLLMIAEVQPAPMVLAISGKAETQESFRLAQLGVRAYLPKPITPESLERAFEEARRGAPDLTPLLRAAVGHKSVRQVEEQVRTTMVAEAMARARGNLSGAARMLEISRQLLQHILKRD